MNPVGSLTAWHPLLVRSLVSRLEDPTVSELDLDVLVAILATLPAPKESHAIIDVCVPLLRRRVLEISLVQALKSKLSTEEANIHDERLCYSNTDGIAVVKGRKNNNLRTKKRRLSGRMRHAAGDSRSRSHVTENVSDTDRDFYRPTKTVQVHERILLSDSDGFAAVFGEAPPADDEANRSNMEQSTLYIMYRSIFGMFPTTFDPLNVLIDSLVLLTQFSVETNPKSALSLLADYFIASSGMSLEDLHCQSGYSLLSMIDRWTNWQRIVRQITRCVKALIRSCKHVLGGDFEADAEKAISLLLGHLIANITCTVKLSEFLSKTDEENLLGNVDDVLRVTNQQSIRIFDEVLSIITMGSNKSYLSTAGSCFVMWSEDATFPLYFDSLIHVIETRLRLSQATSIAEVRFAFELCASLLDCVSVSDKLLDWCVRLPSGFHRSVTGCELLAAITSQVVAEPHKCAQVLRRHLQLMDWSQSSRASSFSCERPSEEEAGAGSFGSRRAPSRWIVRFCTAVNESHSDDTLTKLCTYVISAADEEDVEYVLVEVVIPALVRNCKQKQWASGDSGETMISSMSNDLSPDLKYILKEMELLASHIKTRAAAVEVIREVLVPFRQFYFCASELHDVFVAMCSKACRQAPDFAEECGVVEWLVERFEACLRHASIDVWVFVDDAAAKYFKLLLSVLCLIGEVLELNSNLFCKQKSRLLACTSTMVDLCLEWMRSPNDDYRHIWRVSEALSRSLSIHLLLHSNPDNVVERFFSALNKAMYSNSSSALLSSVVCALLERCVSTVYPPCGSRLSVNQESEDDLLMGEGHPLSSRGRTVQHLSLVPAIIGFVAELLKSMEDLDDKISFMLTRMVTRIITIDRHSNCGMQWISEMFTLCDVLVSKRIPSEVISKWFHMMTSYMRRDPRSDHLYRIIRYFHEGNLYKTTVLETLADIIAEPRQPLSCLVFPQPANNAPMEITRAEQLESEPDQERDVAKETPTSSILNAVERFLSSYRSDGETESERRREKKKHLREQVRGTSMVSMDHVEVAEEAPTATEFCPNAAASFTLNGSHEITSTDGLSLSFWIKRNPSPKITERRGSLVVIALGGDEVSGTLSMSTNGSLVVEFVAADIHMGRQRLYGRVPEGIWTHVVFCVRWSMGQISVQAWVGERTTATDIPMLVRLSKTAFPLTVCLGCVKSQSRRHYMLSSLFGFKGMLPPSCVLVLCGLGCELNSLTETKVEHLHANLLPIINHRLVASRQATLELVLSDVRKYVQKVQRAVVFVLKAQSAHSYGVSVLPADVEPMALLGESALTLALLKDYPISWRARLVQHLDPSLCNALEPLGGAKLVLYLYVKCVNDGVDCDTQRKALDLVFAAIQRGMMASEQKTEIIIARTLACPLAALNLDIVETIARHCVRWTEMDNSMDSLDSMTNVLDPFQAVIRDASLLVTLVCRSELWKGDRWVGWRRLVAAVSSLVDSAQCPVHFRFNRSQLQMHDTLSRILHCLLEMIQDPSSFGDFEVEGSFVNNVVSLIQSLLGSPETPQTVSNVWHFVFLSHPANHTYIDHRVVGHSDWLQPELIRDDVEGELLGDSKLCKTLKNFIQVLGRDHVTQQWQRGTSVFELRKEYEEKTRHESVDTLLTSSSGGIDTRPSLPDLISDLVTDNNGMGGSDDQLMYEGFAVDDVTTEDEVTKEVKGEPRWVVSIRAGLMEVLATVLQNGADSLLCCLQHDVMSWHAIVVLLSHQSDVRIRDAAVDMLQKFLLRCPPYTKVAFLRLHGFHILASQLRSSCVTPTMADFLFSMMCNETIRLGDGLDQWHVAEMGVDRISCESLHAIFTAFEQAVPDLALFWNITSALMKTFENNSQLQQAMMDQHLVDAMVNSLRRIAYLDLPPQENDVIMDDRRKELASVQLEAWSSFAQRIIISIVPYCDSKLNTCCERFIWLLTLADMQAVKEIRYPLEKRMRAHRIIRSQLCQLLHCWLESIRTVFSEEGRSASATSSVDSLYNPGSTSSSPSEEFDMLDDIITPERANQLDGTSPVAAFLTGRFANLRERINHMGPISRKTLKSQYQRRPIPSPLASMEMLTEKMLFALDAIARTYSILTPTDRVTDQEENLFHFFLYFMLTSWRKDGVVDRRQAALGRIGSGVLTVWQRLVTACRERSRVLLAQLVAFVLFPASRKMHEAAMTSRTDVEEIPNWKSDWIEERRKLVVKALAHEMQYKQTLTSLLNVNLDYEYALCIGLYELAFVVPLNEDRQEDIDQMIRFLNTCRVGSSLEGFSPDTLHNLTTDENLSLHTYSQHRKLVMNQLRSKMEAFRDGESRLTAQVSEVAMAVTCEVVEEQNLPRKVFITAAKQAIQQFVQAENAIALIQKELCHPEAVGFDRKRWPIGWALDPTEGPMRERRRLMPYYYPFETRFFGEDRRTLVKGNIDEAPLANILSVPMSARSVMEAAMIEEPIRLFLDAAVLRGTFECQGELLVAETRLHFVGQSARSTQKGTPSSVITLSWRFDQLVEIQTRNHLLKDVAVEMFTTNGDTYLVVFQTQQKRDLFRCQLIESGLNHLFPSVDQMLQTAAQSWRHGIITNFEEEHCSLLRGYHLVSEKTASHAESTHRGYSRFVDTPTGYLMELNKLAGRSFNDLMQYPVFPFVLADYSSTSLDLTSASSFRNLAKPMAIQDKRMEAHYVANYNCLQAECARISGPDLGPHHFGPYHYGSHYSNSGIVVHYLVRLSPYTQIALEYQDNNFDIPDRLFNSVEATWRLASSESTTDFKELIPEFFCLPEFLENRDGLDLGVRQAGEMVASVRLPAWVPKGACRSRLFILIHRQALEASHVTQSLHQWIDLIFGYKQTGNAALDAINVFHPATYMGKLDADQLSDELSQSALRTMIRSYGQMPIQLLTSTHQSTMVKDRKDREKSNTVGPVPSVVGIRWGEFVGSPEQDAAMLQPVLSIKSLKSDRLARVVSLPDHGAAGVPRATLLIISTDNQSATADPTKKPSCVEGVAAVSWAFGDGALRFRAMKPRLQPWINLLDLGQNQISCVTYSSTNRHIYLAFSSGEMHVYRLEYGPDGVEQMRLEDSLLGHRTSVTALVVCDQFSVAVSGDCEGKVLLWDTNRLNLVRVIREQTQTGVTSLCVSKTSGDIAVVSQCGFGSKVQLFTVNGECVGVAETECTVCCVAMTNQNEGCNVNCIALGLRDGRIRIVEMWCMTAVRDIMHDHFPDAVISLDYSENGQRLFVVYATGRVLCWQNTATMGKTKGPQFMICNPYDLG